MASYLTAKTPEEWNTPAYRGRNGHVESYFLKGNDPGEGRAFWLKFTLYAPRTGENHLAEVWAILFDLKGRRVLGAKESYPVTSALLAPGAIQIGSSLFKGTTTSGTLRTQGGEEITWELRMESLAPPLVLFPTRLMYLTPVPRSKTVTPYPDLLFHGTIRSPLGTWELKGARGCQGHNWGKEHAHSYAWVHCNLFEKHEGLVYEGLTARVRIGRRLSPPISIGALLLPGGDTLFFNRLESLRSKEVDYDHTRYRFRLPGKHYVLEGEASLEPEMAAGLTYLNPDGEKGYCLNSKTSSLILRLKNHEGRVVEEFVSPQTAALEILTRDPQHPVKMIL